MTDKPYKMQPPQAEHPAGFEHHRVFDRFPFFSGRLPTDLDRAAMERFEDLWNLHPERSNEILIHGQMVPTPRWQQAYGRDYEFSGSVSQAVPVPTILAPYLDWVPDAVDAQLNGLLLNWYDAERRHYIGAHRDSRQGLVPGSPIVTISLGDTRTFRLRVPKERGFTDFEASHGTLFVMPWLRRTWPSSTKCPTRLAPKAAASPSPPAPSHRADQCSHHPHLAVTATSTDSLRLSAQSTCPA